MVKKVHLFKKLEYRVKGAEARQRLIARNIANSDTPGKKPFDLELKKHSYANAGTMARTHAKHIDTKGGFSKDYRIIEDTENTDPFGEGGSSINAQAELVKMAETKTKHQGLHTIYTNYVGMYNQALSKR